MRCRHMTKTERHLEAEVVIVEVAVVDDLTVQLCRILRFGKTGPVSKSGYADWHGTGVSLLRPAWQDRSAHTTEG